MSQRSERKNQNRQTIIDTVLLISYRGQPFHTISLRQLAKEINLVPSAIYRYFDSKNALAQATIDQVSVFIKSTLLQPKINFLNQHNSVEQKLNLFLDHVTQYASYWHFFVSERWGGYKTLEEAIHNEVEHLITDLMKDSKKMNIYDDQLYIYSELLLQLLLVWSKQWLKLSEVGIPSESNKQIFIQDCQKKICFLRQPIQTSVAI